jgi:N-acetylglucosaminyl-diphospho-decaprenol L-rhamnosyltransferase
VKKLSVIYVSYNSGREILASVASLRAAGSRHELEIIVVDNASPDDSAGLLADEAGIKLIANTINLGYGKAVNLGLEAASGDYYLVLNPDVLVKAGALDGLVEFMETHPKAGIAASRLLNEDGSLQHSCRSFYTFWTILLRRTPLGKLFPRSRAIRHHLMLDFDHAENRRVDWVLGACMLVRPRAVAEVGAMDPRFFLYFEDVDWCYRMRTRGWEVWYVPGTEMLHVHKRASAKNPFSRSLLVHVTSFIHYTEKWNPVAYLIKRYRNPVKGLSLLALDFAAAGGAYLAAIALRRSFHLDYFSAEPYQRFALLYFIIVLGTFYLTGLYRSSRRESASTELLALGRAGLLAGVTLMSSTFLSKERIVSRAVVLISVLLLVVFAGFLRGALRALHRVFLRYNFDLRRLVIVGSESEAGELGQLVLRHPELGLELVGRVRPEGEPPALGALGGISDLERITESERVQEILVAPSASNSPALGSVLIWCRNRNIDLRLLSDSAGAMGRGGRAEEFLGLTALSYRMEGLYPLQRLLKRLVDLIFGLLGFTLSLLPGLIHLLWTRLRGHAGRVSLDILGLKGVRVQLPLAITVSGRSGSDLINPWAYLAVIAGRLSLVGPMPRTDLPEEVGDSAVLLGMRPGLTGAWRRAGQVDELGSAHNLDLFYLRNWSPSLDLQFWLETLGVQLRGRFPQLLLARASKLEDHGPTGEGTPGGQGKKGQP